MFKSFFYFAPLLLMFVSDSYAQTSADFNFRAGNLSTPPSTRVPIGEQVSGSWAGQLNYLVPFLVLRFEVNGEEVGDPIILGKSSDFTTAQVVILETATDVANRGIPNLPNIVTPFGTIEGEAFIGGSISSELFPTDHPATEFASGSVTEFGDLKARAVVSVFPDRLARLDSFSSTTRAAISLLTQERIFIRHLADQDIESSVQLVYRLTGSVSIEPGIEERIIFGRTNVNGGASISVRPNDGALVSANSAPMTSPEIIATLELRKSSDTVSENGFQVRLGVSASALSGRADANFTSTLKFVEVRFPESGKTPEELGMTVEFSSGAISPNLRPAVLGDVNRNDVVDLFDIAPFIEILTSNTFLAEADCDQDGEVNLFDIAPFIEILTGG